MVILAYLTPIEILKANFNIEITGLFFKKSKCALIYLIKRAVMLAVLNQLNELKDSFNTKITGYFFKIRSVP